MITAAPALLLVHLKRFRTEWSARPGEAARQVYLTQRVVCEDPLLVHETSYRLLAKVYHMGESLRDGHYYTVCRHERPEGAWWLYNDVVRRLVRPEDEDHRNVRVHLCLYERT